MLMLANGGGCCTFKETFAAIMKTHLRWAGLGLAILLGLGLTVESVQARNLYGNEEVEGTILKIDNARKTLKIDPGANHKTKYIKWDHKTDVRKNGRILGIPDLKDGQQVKVEYVKVKGKTAKDNCLAVKVLIREGKERAGLEPSRPK